MKLVMHVFHAYAPPIFLKKNSGQIINHEIYRRIHDSHIYGYLLMLVLYAVKDIRKDIY